MRSSEKRLTPAFVRKRQRGYRAATGQFKASAIQAECEIEIGCGRVPQLKLDRLPDFGVITNGNCARLAVDPGDGTDDEVGADKIVAVFIDHKPGQQIGAGFVAQIWRHPQQGLLDHIQRTLPADALDPFTRTGRDRPW